MIGLTKQLRHIELISYKTDLLQLFLPHNTVHPLLYPNMPVNVINSHEEFKAIVCGVIGWVLNAIC